MFNQKNLSSQRTTTAECWNNNVAACNIVSLRKQVALKLRQLANYDPDSREAKGYNHTADNLDMASDNEVRQYAADLGIYVFQFGK